MAGILLRAAGYEVYTASSAAEAISIADQLDCRLNLLLTDMVMPGMDGHELIAAIRRICPFMDVLAMSGALEPEDVREKGYKIVQKPFGAPALLNEVKQILEAQIRF